MVVANLIDVIIRAETTFNDTEASKNWLRTKNEKLDNETPFEICHTENGIQKVLNILDELDDR